MVGRLHRIRRLGRATSRGHGVGGGVPEPSIGLSGQSINENSAAGTFVGTFFVSHGSGSYTFSLTNTAGNRFAIDGDDLEAGAVATNYESATSHAIVVDADNGVDPVISRGFTIDVINVNEAPIITSNGGGATAAVSINEGTTAVTTVVAGDVDAGTVIAYSISGGADAALFSINSSSGALRFITAPDYETPLDADTDNDYIVIVRASDGVLSDTQTITVTVNDVVDETFDPSLDFSDDRNSQYVPLVLEDI